MILIATADPDLARKIGGVLDGNKSYLITAVDAKALRYAGHSNQPEVVILDVRLGGNRFRALGEAEALMAMKSAPAIIVISPWRAQAVHDEAARAGCFDVIVLDRRGAFLRRLARSVSEAQAARLAGALSSPSRREPGSLH